LNSLGRVRILPPKPHKTQSVKCPVNLIKSSLQIIPVDETKKNYRLQFILDVNETCTVKVYYVATETKYDDKDFTFEPALNSLPITFQKGLGQLYEQPTREYMDVSQFKEGDLFYTEESTTYPVVIVVDTENKDKRQAASQTTYATLIHCNDDIWVIKPIKQRIWYDGKSYTIHDIFGIENESDGGRDCVICMTEARNTTVLPCRHLCLCGPCAEKLRLQSNKCPICRSTIKSMVEVEFTSKMEKVEDVDEGILVKKGKSNFVSESKLEEV